MSSCRAAVYLEIAEYHRCKAKCDSATEKDDEIMADYKVIAHALTRKANALCKCLTKLCSERRGFRCENEYPIVACRAAVYLETAEYDKCIADCDSAVEKGRDIRADYKVIARALTRKANALAKKERYAEAVDVYHKSLTEHRYAICPW